MIASNKKAAPTEAAFSFSPSCRCGAGALNCARYLTRPPEAPRRALGPSEHPRIRMLKMASG